MMLVWIVYLVLLSFSVIPRGALAVAGGEDTTDGQFPFMVSVVEIYTGFFAGSGVILTPRWVLTVAQTIDNMGYLSVRAGSTHIHAGGNVYNVTQAIIHEDYFGSLTRWKNDIGLLRLGQDILLSSTVGLATLPLPGTFPEAGTEVTLVAWGRTEGNFSAPIKEEQQFLTDIHTIDLNRCHDSTGLPTFGVVCASHLHGAGTCFGDQGGGLVSSSGVVLAIHSFTYSWQCGTGSPDFYTDPAYFASWITTHMSNQTGLLVA